MTLAPPDPTFGAPIEVAAAPAVLEFLARRRSTSALSLTEPSPDKTELDLLLRLAARVPDHGKLAPWRFVILEGADKAAFAGQLDALAAAKGDQQAQAKLGKLKAPPLCVAVIASPKPAAIPVWEQLLSAGAVCTNLLYGALAMGYGANWITDWYAYDAQACALLGLTGDEKVAGYVLIGTPAEAPLERERPALGPLVTRWQG